MTWRDVAFWAAGVMAGFFIALGIGWFLCDHDANCITRPYG